MIRSLIVKTLILPAVAGGAYLAGSHGELPTAATDAPAAAPTTLAPVPQAAGPMTVSIEITEDGKVITRQAPADSASGATGKAAPKAPQSAAEPPAATSEAAAPPPSAAPSATPTAVPPFANCSAVRAAGKGPIHRGDPGWADKLDRNGDGVACAS